MKIYFKDLDCFKDEKLTDKDKKMKGYSPNSFFDLDLLPATNIRYEFANFILDRGKSIRFSSVLADREHYRNLAIFLSDKYPLLQSLIDIPFPKLNRDLEKWVFQSETLSVTSQKMSDAMGKVYQYKNPVHNYLRQIYEYLSFLTPPFSKDMDRWYLSRLPIEVIKTPQDKIQYLTFEGIEQEEMKKDIKDAAFYRLKIRSVNTVNREIFCVRTFLSFLGVNFPEIESFPELSRKHIEEYLSYLYLEDDQRKDESIVLIPLKSFLQTLGKLKEYENLHSLFLYTDIPRKRNVLYQSYSDAELKRLHEGYRHLEPQTARILLIHEYLGTRISETLSLKRKDIHWGEKPYIEIFESKTNRTYQKPINGDLLALLQASIEYTEEHYGQTEYVFVRNKDPSRPFCYGTLQNQFYKMVRKQGLKRDNGEYFSCTTHLFRHTYGKKLCDMGFSDEVIAKLLGHAGLTSVSAYRRMSSSVLQKESKTVVENRNDKIGKFMKGWMDNG